MSQIARTAGVSAGGLVAFAVLASGLRAQDLRAVPELDAKGRAAAAIELRREKGKPTGDIALVQWGEVEIPLDSATPDCAVGVVDLGKDAGKDAGQNAGKNAGKDVAGKALVILAGGVRSSLDVYLVRADGDFVRFATEGGRRLPRKFNSGAGSWPKVEGGHLLVFGYQKGTGVEIRAMDFAGRVMLERNVTAKVEAFTVASAPDRGVVRVGFGGVVEPVTFRHPLAPKLELSKWGLIEFDPVRVGSVGRQFLEFSNKGKRTLTLRATLDQEGFRFGGELPKTLAPGASHRLRIEFVPKRVAAYDVGLKIFANGVVAECTVRLRGRGTRAAKVGGDGTKNPGAAVVPRKGAEEPRAKLASPIVLDAKFVPRGDGEVLVLGRIRTSSSPRIALRFGKSKEVVAALDPDGRFHATLRAAAGADLELCAVDATERRSSFVRFGEVPAMLAIEGKHAVVRCQPNESFVLTARADGEVLRRWRGQVDGAGERRVPLSILGSADGAPALSLEVTIAVEGAARVSNRVRLN